MGQEPAARDVGKLRRAAAWAGQASDQFESFGTWQGAAQTADALSRAQSCLNALAAEALEATRTDRTSPECPALSGLSRPDETGTSADEPRRVCRQLYSGWLNLPKVGAVRDHAVEHAEQLPGRCGQSGFHRFSCLLQVLPERSEHRRVTGGMQGGEIEGGPDGCPSATDDPSSAALASIPGDRRKAGESRDLSEIGSKRPV